MRVNDAQRQMLHELRDASDENAWLNFDPPFNPRTTAALVSRKLVETTDDGTQLRLTDAGRAFVSADKSCPGGMSCSN